MGIYETAGLLCPACQHEHSHRDHRQFVVGYDYAESLMLCKCQKCGHKWDVPDERFSGGYYAELRDG